MQQIGIYGSKGRMGQTIVMAIVEANAGFAGGVDQGDDAQALAQMSDVLVDFSAPDALEGHLDACVAAGKPLIVGTTGLKERHHFLIDHAAEHIAVLQTGNTSLGVNMLAALVAQAAARLDEDWDIEIAEMHHRHKVDAPSGTALLLGQAAADARGVDAQKDSERERANIQGGMTGPRKRGAIGYASLRGGSVAGDHSVIFAGEHERIELTHRAENRNVFAGGAIRAALWLIGKPAGRYEMKDVLGL